MIHFEQPTINKTALLRVILDKATELLTSKTLTLFCVDLQNFINGLKLTNYLHPKDIFILQGHPNRIELFKRDGKGDLVFVTSFRMMEAEETTKIEVQGSEFKPYTINDFAAWKVPLHCHMCNKKCTTDTNLVSGFFDADLNVYVHDYKECKNKFYEYKNTTKFKYMISEVPITIASVHIFIEKIKKAGTARPKMDVLAKVEKTSKKANNLLIVNPNIFDANYLFNYKFEFNDAGCCLNPIKAIYTESKKFKFRIEVANVPKSAVFWVSGSTFEFKEHGSSCGACTGKNRPQLRGLIPSIIDRINAFFKSYIYNKEEENNVPGNVIKEVIQIREQLILWHMENEELEYFVFKFFNAPFPKVCEEADTKAKSENVFYQAFQNIYSTALNFYVKTKLESGFINEFEKLGYIAHKTFYYQTNNAKTSDTTPIEKTPIIEPTTPKQAVVKKQIAIKPSELPPVKAMQKNNSKSINDTYAGGKNASGVYQFLINHVPPVKCIVSGFLGHCGLLKNIKPAKLMVGIDKDVLVTDRWNKENTSVKLITGDFLLNLDWVNPKQLGATLVFLDPPYLNETRANQGKLYNHEFETTEQHKTLLEKAVKFPCFVMITAYENELYNSYLDGKNGFTKHYFNGQTRGGRKQECMYINYEVPTQLHDYKYYGTDYRERWNNKKLIDRTISQLKDMPPLRRNMVIDAILNQQF